MIKRECRKCNIEKPLDAKNFSTYKTRVGKVLFPRVCKACKLIYERAYKSKLHRDVVPKVYIERAVIGHKNEPYYIGENDRENDLQRILSYKTWDVWTQE